MIDPSNITNYNLNKYQLQEMLIFWILVAGKTAKTTVKMLENMLQNLQQGFNMDLGPFELIKKYDAEFPDQLEIFLKKCGFGCQTSKAKSLRQLVNSSLDLNNCTVEDLENIHGIGPKTARCFLIHTRANARYAGLDTHILKWLKSLGYEVPKSTPTKRIYHKLEEIFLQLCDSLDMTPAVLDLAIWNAYSSGNEYMVKLNKLLVEE